MNQKDIFKEQLKSVFSNFEAPVPHDGWEKIEQSLNVVARAKIVRRNWYIGSAAATVAILLGSLFFLKSPQTIEQNLPTLTEKTTLDKIKSTDKQDVKVAKVEPAMENKKSRQPKLARQKQEILVAKQTGRSESPIISNVTEQAPENIVIAEQPEEKKIQATEERKTQPEEKKAVQPNQEEIDRLIQEFENAGKTDIFRGLTVGKSKNKPLMLALNAKGGLRSSQKTVVNSPMTLRSASVEKSDENTNKDFYLGDLGNNLSAVSGNTALMNTLSVADNVAEKEHDQPVSFGITVSKNIVDRFSVEVGLVYTYLFSRAKNTSVDFQNQETQYFHYLGIPLNINYNFLNFGKLGLYTSFGGMIEKDIYGKKQYQAQITNELLNGMSKEWTIEKISQENPQISVNAGVGAYYPIYGGFNLYGKIGGSYYFDAKNTEKTIYTDKKIVFDLNAGIRFDF